MQVWTKGPFRIVVEEGDTDPPKDDELSISLRVDADEVLAAAGLSSNGIVRDAQQAFDVLHRVEEAIGAHLGRLAPEVRDHFRNEIARRVPGLEKALGWSR